MSAREQLDVGDFASIVSPSSEGAASWVPAAFPDPSGGSWTFAEPNAVVIVQDGRLRVAAAPYTRQHDSVQILDNAKHMYFSTRAFEAPEQGSMRVDWEMAARVVDAVPGDLYDGFVSFHLLDLGTGTALDIFASNEVVSSHVRMSSWYDLNGCLDPMIGGLRSSIPRTSLRVGSTNSP